MPEATIYAEQGSAPMDPDFKVPIYVIELGDESQAYYDLIDFIEDLAYIAEHGIFPED